MHIEIRDLQNSETFRIDQNGTTLGRDKARATIAVPDSGVSGLHARISLKDDKWWIEDLKSSNGTFVDDEKLKPGAPAQLLRGTTFKFHAYRYEVIDIEPDGEGQKTAIFNQATQVGKVESTVENQMMQEEDVAPPSAPVKSGTVKSGSVPTGLNAFAAEKSEPTKSEKSAPVKASSVKPGSREASTAIMGGSFGSEIGKAVAYYLVAIPAFLFNFKGGVQQAVDNQPRPPMEKMTLAAWAVPANVLGVAVGQLVALLTMIVAGAFAPVSWIIGLVIALAIAVGVSIVSGFLFHPVMNWVITKLKGQSDEKSRTNYFVSVMTAVGLQTVIGGIGGLFGLLVFIPYVGPFLGIIPILLTAVASLITIYVFYQWFESFGVVKWFLTVIKVLAVLTLLVVLYGAVNVIRAGIAGLSGGGGTVTVDATGSADVVNEDVKKQAEEAKANAEKAMADAKENAKGAAKEATPKADPKAEAKAAKEEAKAAAKVGKTEDYETYAKKREAIEKAIEKNPTLLTRTQGVLPLYKALHKDIKAVSEKYKKSKGDPVAERLKEAETYDRTVEAVTELHKKLLEK